MFTAGVGVDRHTERDSQEDHAQPQDPSCCQRCQANQVRALQPVVLQRQGVLRAGIQQDRGACPHTTRRPDPRRPAGVDARLLIRLSTGTGQLRHTLPEPVFVLLETAIRRNTVP